MSKLQHVQDIPTIYPTINITIGEYYDMLSKHDWFYSYSDDNGVYHAGRTNNQLLIQISRVSPFASYMYHTFSDAAHHVGLPFPTIQQLKQDYDLRGY